MDGVQVNCNECCLDFKVGLMVRNTEDVEVHYFNCTECNEEYIAYCLNDSIKAKQFQIRKLWKDYSKAKDLKEKESLIDKLEEINKKLRIEMAQLKSIYVMPK